MDWSMFWNNVGNPKLPKSEYLYSWKHLLCIGIVIALVIALSIIFRNKSQKAKDFLIKVFGWFFLFWEVSTRIVNLITTTDYSFASIIKIILPMHICSVIVWVFIIMAFTKNKTLINFSAICGLLATVAFLAYPSTGFVFTYPTFTVLYSISSHMMGFVVSVLLITLGYAKFEFKDLWKMLLCFAIMLAYGALIDFVILPGENYMFLIEPPVEILSTIPYQIVYGVLLLAYIMLFYVISAIVKKCKKTSNKKSRN